MSLKSNKSLFNIFYSLKNYKTHTFFKIYFLLTCCSDRCNFFHLYKLRYAGILTDFNLTISQVEMKILEIILKHLRE